MSIIQKFLSTVRIELSTQLAYKLNFVLVILGPPLVFFFIKANLWWSIFHIRGDSPVGHYTLDSMLEYQAYVLVVNLLCQSYVSRNISEDIRFGRISAFLLYPVSFVGYHFGSFAAAQVLNIATAALVIGCLWALGFTSPPALESLAGGIALTMLLSVFWFSVWFLLSCSSFWLEESWVLRVVFSIIARFLSGAIIPLDLFPPALEDALWSTPFPYLTFVPTQYFTGAPTVAFASASMVTLLWTVAAFLAAMALWRRGLRHYSAAGM